MRVAVAGGGISGLACAHYLKRAGIDAIVFDPTPGGLIGSVNVEGCILESGPESWLSTKPAAEQLIREIGLGDQIYGSNDPARRTYVLRHGRFETLPEGLQLVVPTKILPVLQSRLFTWGTKLRMATEVFQNPKTLPDRTVADFVADHFGREAVDYLAEPLLAGVYGGSPDSLSAPSVLPKFVEYEQRLGSVVVGALREKKPASGKPVFSSLRRGMGALTDALKAKLDIIPEKIEAIRLSDSPESGAWSVYAAGEWRAFDHVVLACGANNAARLMQPVNPSAADLLASIPHTSSAIWSLIYRREDIAHKLDAFGFLIPAKERNAIMACTWVATKWLGRIPADKAVLRCFSTDIGVTLEAVKQDLRRLMGITAEPIHAFDSRCPEAMPQYTVGHTGRVQHLEECMAAIPGLHLAGNAYHGVGIPDCIRSGKVAADAIAAQKH